ncbi:MAG TPA: hypothetical protein VND94_18745 [Terriglobia bacterium]|nr:hypothetical protein [Terriglobia bacterium]
MHWMKCSLTGDQLAEGALIQITNNFTYLVLDGRAPTNAILFYRERTDGMDFFASPLAAGLLEDPALMRFHWRQCDKPCMEGLMVLAGQGDPSTLFGGDRQLVTS